MEKKGVHTMKTNVKTEGIKRSEDGSYTAEQIKDFINKLLELENDPQKLLRMYDAVDRVFVSDWRKAS